MTWRINDKEYKSVITLPDDDRYIYSIKRIADWEELWSLWSEDGWVLSGDDKGNQIVPIWPHERFASSCIAGEWFGTKARKIELNIWMERWLPGMSKDNRLVAVFPTPELKGVVVTPERMKKDLEEEMLLYE